MKEIVAQTLCWSWTKSIGSWRWVYCDQQKELQCCEEIGFTAAIHKTFILVVYQKDNQTCPEVRFCLNSMILVPVMLNDDP